ncbi:MAG TPA: MarR family transcriptional regulator [Acidimicrobiales bacterium]|jgi:DNA-binding MarR family transcriptional regulator|nr:MarR family transcriptional regulator [Acidimicrobiales bacterium]
MPKKPDDRRMRAWESMLFAHTALLRQLDHDLAEQFDMPLPWYEVLLLLYRAPCRRMRMQELGERLVFTPSGMTRLIDRMAEAGLVRREECPSDRRGKFAALTDEGVARFREAGPVHLKGIQEHFGRHVSDDEADVIGDALGRVLDRLRS